MPNHIPHGVTLVRDFVNTANLEDATDEIASPSALRRWLAAAGLVNRPGRLTKDDQARAVIVREALRDLIDATHGGPAATQARAILNEAARRADLRPGFTADGTATFTATAPGVDGALGAILAAAHEAMTGGDWSKLKLCGRASCRWAYVDTSRNRSRRWCSMEVCGNRAKAEAFRSRSRATTDPAA